MILQKAPYLGHSDVMAMLGRFLVVTQRSAGLLPQPHARPPAVLIDELDAGRLERGADGRGSGRTGRPLGILEADRRPLWHSAGRDELLETPTKKPASRPCLIR